MIVLAGEISGSARQRLTREISNGPQILDLAWLVEKFTDYYPQVYFEGKAIDFVQQKIQLLETKFGMKKGKNLSECFVEPIVADFEAPIELSGKSVAIAVRREKMPFSRLEQVVTASARQKLFLIGDPGTGKSFALAKLALDMFMGVYAKLTRSAGTHEKAGVPIFVTAKELIAADSLETLLEAYFGESVKDRFSVEALLVDGLDEVSPSLREQAITKANEFADRLEACLLITSRKVDLIKSPVSGFDRYEIMPFEFGQAIRLFEKLVNNSGTMAALKEGLGRIRWQIPMVPLSLMLLIELVEERREVPASVTELYEQFSDMVLGRWDRQKGIEVLFDYQIKKRFLGALAWSEFVSKNRVEMGSDEFDTFVSSYAARYGFDAEKLKGFIGEIQRAGVLDFGESVSYRHKSFLEFFAATDLELHREELPDLNSRIVRIYFDELWSEVAFFYIGLRREISYAVLQGIEQYVGDGLNELAFKLLVGRLLQAGWHSPSETKARGILMAVSKATAFRERLLADLAAERLDVPKIVCDAVVLMLAELALSSAFLLEETEKLFGRLSGNGTLANVDMMLSLLWANRKLLTKDAVNQAINRVLETIQAAHEMSPENQARALVVLTLIDKNEGSLNRSLKRKVERLQRRVPELFRLLLPSRKDRRLGRIRGPKSHVAHPAPGKLGRGNSKGTSG